MTFVARATGEEPAGARPSVVLPQRERNDDVPGALSLIAYLVVAAIAAALIVLIAWVLPRLEGAGRRRREPRAARRTAVGEPELV